MPWTFTNQQQDPMTLNNGAVAVQVMGGATVNIAQGPATITYHRLTYTRVGIWPFPDNQNVVASYDQGQNINVQNQQTRVTAIYHYDGP